ncbi:hypothetical protein HELRODRAFT_110634 [Helobdella robusta]|uniref:Protoporphyrinogen oxidase n=1 Tax=Helobdella robusta TaxID=6412 RepID=T1EF37_HELRO|nr:hypothetical protein HELRODRAFT_110634 [Helobdella robusta]ESO07106.1 hypothetical protein HELRODRAFT_110634 [Helobdella robusta]
MATCAVLGGGISGLATAYYLNKFGGNLVKKIILIEGTNRFGGWMRSVKYEKDLLFEQGPRSIRGVGRAGFNTLEMVEDLELDDEVLPIPRSHVAAKNRFIYVNKQLCKLPSSLKAVLTTQPPFSKPLCLYGLMEPFRKKGELDDETVDSFFSRRFGPEVAKYAANSMCRGIFAGDSLKLSMRSCFPLFHEFESKYGSIVKAALMRPRTKRRENSELINKFVSENWSMWSLKNGLEDLPRKLLATLQKEDKVKVMSGSKVNTLQFDDVKVKLVTSANGEIMTVDHVFSALPSFDISLLLLPTYANISSLLNDIRFASVGVVNLVYPSDVTTPQVGFGHLIPSFEDPAVLGVLYECHTFPHHNGRDNKTRITLMMGGAWFEECFGSPETADKCKFEEMALKAVSEQLSIKQRPEMVVVNVQKYCIPQYKVGHHKLLEEAESLISKNNLQLSLVGSSYRGMSINDCIFNGKLQVQQYLGIRRDDE